MEELYHIVFAWTLGILFCFLLVIVEWIGTHFFFPLFFRLGIPVYKQTIDVKTTAFMGQPGTTIKKAEGKFKFSFDDRVYFLSRTMLYRNVSTLFSLKATGTIQTDNKIDIVARLPVSATVLIPFVIFSGVAGGISGGSAALVFWGYAFAFVIGALMSYGIEKARMDRMVNELQEIMETNSI